MTNGPFTLITGASSGIGRAIAAQLSAVGPLLLHGRDEARLRETLAACVEPARHRLWACELADVSTVAASLEAVMAEAPLTVDGFVHSAGVVEVLPLRSTTLERTARLMNVNVFSATEIAKVLLKRKLNAGALKRVVFVSSIHSRLGIRGQSMYSASKAALNSLARSLAVELAPDVRVNAVLAGAVRTPMSEAVFADEAQAKHLEEIHPLGTGAPADVAKVVAFLMSDGARWVTGQEIVVDGGRGLL